MGARGPTLKDMTLVVLALLIWTALSLITASAWVLLSMRTKTLQLALDTCTQGRREGGPLSF